MMAAPAHAQIARRHSIAALGGRKEPVLDLSGGKAGSSLAEALPPTGIAASVTVTRICGAPHCAQNGFPSSMLWPHL
jgi:hypothetical protein